MKMSRRARRMDRHHQMARSPGLNLVSLMDIFTILVFFLLVNSSNSQQLPNNKELRLPESISEVVPEESLTIAITREQILVQGVLVASLAEALQQTEDVIEPLKEELLFLAGGDAIPNSAAPADGRSVTVMGHEDIPYQVIKKILQTCRHAGYTQIAFAANQILKPEG
ncbi:ExbD/TolR family protein [Gilvimarinus sp. F26214L]|uniref:ExbD/TolR family protein n=1 Tax=Gilvimarinus sp. DZF01 TaxID=3461371 RepID=UPI004045980D